MDIPDTLSGLLTPEWLTRALQQGFPGVEITAVSTGPIVARVATNARFTVVCSDGGPPNMPDRMCVKAYLSDSGLAAQPAGIPEVLFYQQLQRRIPIRTPRCLHVEVDFGTGANVLITEDVVAAGGRFLDCFSAFSPDQMALSLSQLAGLHAATWNSAELEKTSWLAPRMGLYLQSDRIKVMAENLNGPIGALVPNEVRDVGHLVAAYRQVGAAVAAAHPWSVIHGDPHILNLYLDAAGQPCFVDWQLVQRGSPFIDVGYHIASGLPWQLRRDTENALVGHYLDELAARSIELPALEQIWRGIRYGMVHGFYLWAITKYVAPAVTAELLTRLGTAVADHRVFDMI